jgi:uncharacterized protein
MRLVSLAALCLVLLPAGCKQATAPSAPSSPTPAEVSSSDQVVKVYTHFIPSASPPANVELVVSPGFHINANPATFSYLIATEVQPGKVEGITISDKLAYPAPKMETFAFAEKPLAVYEGSVTVPLPVKAAPDATGQRTIPIKIRVQACDTQQCFPPATLDTSLSLDLNSIPR